MASMTISRATVRDFEDDHLIQEVTAADVFKSETATNKGAPLERFQMVGLTSRPLKQQEEEGQTSSSQQSSSGNSDGGDYNQNQPKGPAAEAMMMYLNGSRAHPVAMVDDRRVRPYQMKEGDTAVYHADGSEQMTYFNENGAYLVSLDGKSVKDKKTDKTRMASLRHVTKKMQSHKIEQQQNGQQRKQSEDYKHEGESINTEVRCTKGRIEFRTGDKVVGYYDVQEDTWFFTGKLIHNKATERVKDEAPKIEHN
jgi:phage gp45-like